MLGEGTGCPRRRVQRAHGEGVEVAEGWPGPQVDQGLRRAAGNTDLRESGWCGMRWSAGLRQVTEVHRDQRQDGLGVGVRLVGSLGEWDTQY